MLKQFYPYFALFIIVLMADQISKIYLNNFLVYGESFYLFPGADLLLVYNTGAAFGILSEQSGWQRWFLSAISIVISILLIFWIKVAVNYSKIESFSLTAILAGAMGNLIDRLLYGYVIDFIHLYWGEFSWPNFNVADSSITFGAVLLIYSQVVSGKSKLN